MRKEYRWILVLVGFLSISAPLAAQEPLRWEPTLESAKRRAAASNRLVLIHFRADWCGACQKMEKEVFEQPGVAMAVQAYFVPVKVNADYFPATRRQYGVTALPTDVIITARGKPVERILGPIDAASYVAHLNRVAMSTQGGNAVGYAQNRAAPSSAAMPPNAPLQARPGYQPGNVPSDNAPRNNAANDPDDRYANYFSRPPSQPPPQRQPAPQQQQSLWGHRPVGPPAQPPFAPPQQAQAGPPAPNVPPQVAQTPAPNPPLGLDGYCPVELTENVTWVLGDRKWGALHRGRTYLFAGPEQQRRFLAQPDRYAPALAGNDVVIAVEDGRHVSGHRKHGVFFGGKVYLFTDEASLAKFSKNPNHYASRAVQSAQAGVQQRRHFR